MKASRVLILIVSFSLLICACNLPVGANSPDKRYPTEKIETLEPITLATETRQVVVIEMTSPAQSEVTPEIVDATPIPQLSPTTYVPFTLNTFADGVNVRTNPGYLFPIRGMVQSDTSLKVLGRSPGDEWLYIQTLEGMKGWVYVQLFNKEARMFEAPLIEPEDIRTIRGRLLDAAGQPVSGIQFALTQGSGNNGLRNDATTDENGVLRFYMPLNSSGAWMISYVAISCDSNVVDENCNSSGTVIPSSASFDIQGDNDLVFTWK